MHTTTVGCSLGFVGETVATGVVRRTLAQLHFGKGLASQVLGGVGVV